MSYPSYAAKRVLEDLGINTPEDLQFLEEIAWTRGALIKEFPLTGAEARLTVYRNKAIITISSNIQNTQRKRFSIAHELGHLEIHRSSSSLAICISEDIDNETSEVLRKKTEQEANEFASALLLPEHLFKPLCNEEDPSLACVKRLSNMFDTSLTATALRYIEFSDEPIAVVYSENKYIKWVQQSSELKEMELYINPRRKLDDRTVAASLVKGRKRVNANAWFDEGYLDKDAHIVEHSLYIPNYNSVLTLLWVDEEINHEDEDW